MTLRSQVIAVLLNLLLNGFRLFPRRLLPAAADLFAALAPWILRRDQKLIAANCQRVYQLPAHSRFAKEFQKQVFRSQFVILLETIQSTLAKKDPNTLEGIQQLSDIIKQLMEPGRGLIVVTGHLGCWEFVARYTAEASGKTFYALAKPAKIAEFTRLMERFRARMNTIILWTDRKNILREMLKTLKSGACLGFVMDQKPEGRIGPLVNFLGQATEFVSGPAKLAIRQGSPVLAIFCMRTGPQRYRLMYEVIAPADHGQGDETLLTQKMATAIETVIRLYPEQWLWNYKRWRPSQNTAWAESTLGSNV